MPRISKTSKSPGRAALLAMRKGLLAAPIFLLAAVMLFPNLPAAQAAPAWSAPQILSPGDFCIYDRNPEIALDASGNSHVVWIGYNGSYNILYSTDASGSWSEPVIISDNPVPDTNCIPQIAVDSSGYAHVVWRGFDADWNRRVLYATSQGSGWSGPEAISGDNTVGTNPMMALDGNDHPHVVWDGSNGTNDRIYYNTYSGSAWLATPTDITGSLGNNHGDPRIAVDSLNHPHVAWSGSNGTNTRIYYNTYSGTAWLATPVETSTGLSGYQYFPDIAVGANNLPHVVWYGSSNQRIYYNTYSGSAWLATPTDISTGPSYLNNSPVIKVDSQNHPHVAWRDYEGTADKIYYNVYSGTSWLTTATEISTGVSSKYDPDLALDPNDRPHVVWNECVSSADPKVYYNVYSGTAWLTTPTEISDGRSNINDKPRIAVDGSGCPHVVFFGSGDDTPFLVWYTEKPGTAWSDPLGISQPSYEGSIENYQSQIAVGPDERRHAVWFGFDGAGYQVYYASDSGAGWSAPQVLSTNSYENYEQQLALGPEGNPQVVWTGKGDEENDARDVYYSTDPGTGWTAPLVVSAAGTYNGEPGIVVGEGDVPHLVWSSKPDSDETNREIYYATNTGSGWTAPLNVSTTSDTNDEPRMAMGANGLPQVVWVGHPDGGSVEHVYYRSKTGTGWTGPTSLSETIGSSSRRPQLAVGPDNVPNVVWSGQEAGHTGLFIYYATNPGTGWTATEEISDYACEYNEIPQIALGPQGLPQVVWDGQLAEGEPYDIYYTVKQDTGWTDPLKLSGEALQQNYYPRIAVDSYNRPHVSWKGLYLATNRFTSSVLYATDPGTGWEAPQVLSTYDATDLDRLFLNSCIALDIKDNVHLVWDGFDSDGVVRAWYANNVEYEVTAAVSGGGGDVSPASQAVVPGGTATIGMTPYPGYYIAGVTDNGSEVLPTPASPYTISGVNTDHEVVVTYSNLYTIDSSAGPGGSIDPAGAVQVAYGSGQTFTITPDTDYRIADVLVDGVSVGPVGTYTFPAVTTGHTIEASFAYDLFTWYLPEGSTSGGMETWVLLENPGTEPVTVDLVFDTGSGEVALPALAGLTVPAESRISCDVTPYITTYDLATRVIAHGGPVDCERATYGNNRAWGTTSTGSPATATQWCMAEGSTSGGMESWILVQNPGDTPAEVTLKFLTGAGEVSGPAATLAAHTRTSWRVNDWVTTYDVATEVTSDNPVACERAMYGGEQGDGWAWATSSAGTPFASGEWYLPGLHTSNSSWLLVANPNTQAADIDVKYYTGGNMVQGPQASVPARSRVTFNAADYVPDAYVSASITSAGSEVVCEWAEYAPDLSWGVSSLAAPGLAYDLFFTEGSTSGGMHTFITLFNPGDADVTATLILYTGGGKMMVPALTDVTVPARGTYNANLNDYVDSYDVSTLVVADGPLTGRRTTSCPDSGWCTASGSFAIPY